MFEDEEESFRTLLPRTHPGWLAAACIILIGLFFYYHFVYGYLSDQYQNMLYGPRMSAVPISEKNKDLDNVYFLALAPEYLSPFIEKWIFVYVNNQGEQPLQDVRVWVNITRETIDRQPEVIETRVILLTPSPGSEQDYPLLVSRSINSNVFLREVKFEYIAPHSVASGRISISGSEPVWVTYWFSLGDKLASQITYKGRYDDRVKITVDSGRAFKHSLIETLLLPPLANGIIPLLLLVLCAWAESKAMKITSCVLPIILLDGFGLRLMTVTFVLSALFGVFAFGIILAWFAGQWWGWLLLLPSGAALFRLSFLKRLPDRNKPVEQPAPQMQ